MVSVGDREIKEEQGGPHRNGDHELRESVSSECDISDCCVNCFFTIILVYLCCFNVFRCSNCVCVFADLWMF